MTIGPEPIRRIFSMSSLRGKGKEPVEEMARVVGTRPGLWVVLNGRSSDVSQDQSLHRSVVKIQLTQLRDPEVRLPAHRLVAVDPRLAAGALDREAVVLGGDVDPPGLEGLGRGGG